MKFKFKNLASKLDKSASVLYNVVNKKRRYNIMSKELGKKISDAIKHNGITQRELAIKVGVTEAVISRYISGEREPKPEVLANIATALYTTSDYLLGIESDGSVEKDYPQIKRLIARNASTMTDLQKKELLSVLFDIN